MPSAPQDQKREWRMRQPRDDTRQYRSAKEHLNGPCTIHGFRNKRGELRSSHTLRNCRSFNELAEEKHCSAAATAQPLASIAVRPITHNAPPAPPLPARQVASIQERQRTPDADQYPEAHGRIYMIQEGRPSNRQQKQVTGQVFLATSAHPAVPEYLRGSETEITFSRDDHPPVVPRPGHAALVLEARIGNYNMSRVFMDGGSGINIIFTRTLDDMLIQNNSIKSSCTTFLRIVPGKAVYPLGKISLEVVFGSATNFRKETLDFEVVDWKYQYHAILGRPAFVRFMAVPHYAYLKLKMPGPRGIITVSDSFIISDRCDREFHKISETFGAHQASRATTQEEEALP